MRLRLPVESGLERLDIAHIERDAGAAGGRLHAHHIEQVPLAGGHHVELLVKDAALAQETLAAFPVGALEELQAARDRVLRIGGLDGARIGRIDEGEPAQPVAPPSRARQRLEQGAKAVGLLGELAQGFGRFLQLETIPGRLAQAQHGAAGDRAPLRLDELAARRLHGEVEAFAPAAQPVERGFDRGRAIGSEPGAEGEEPIHVGLRAEEALVPLDHRRLVFAGPDDEDLALRIEEELRPVERGFGFGRAVGERA